MIPGTKPDAAKHGRTYEPTVTIGNTVFDVYTNPGESFSRVLCGCCNVGSIGHNRWGWEYRVDGQRNWQCHPQTLNADRDATIDALYAEYNAAQACPGVGGRPPEPA